MPIIKKPNEYFDVITYTGDGTSSRNITGLNFQPDFVWIKVRSLSTSHALTDSVRQAPNQLSSNSTGAEVTDYYYGGVSAFLSNGFTVVAGGGGSPRVNESGQTYVAWCWKANGTGVTNTAGSITSTVSANTTSGFSVVTYTGTGSSATVGHGLGVKPAMIIFKNRGSAYNWRVLHQSLSSQTQSYLSLNLTNAVGTDATIWNNTAPTSTVFSVGADASVNESSKSTVAYCFAEVAGFSKFGSYTGNGNTSGDGTFIYLGFKPAFFMCKPTSTTGGWEMLDNERLTYNGSGSGLYLYANESSAENAYGTASSGTEADFLSNGVKLKGGSGINGSGVSYIYMAFAENPFKYSLAR